MSSTCNALSDSTSRASISLRRKPPPPALMQRPASASACLTLPQQQSTQQADHSLHKLSFSERYPDPDPTDPFAPLWVLRNRTSSALHREDPPILGHLLGQTTADEFGFRQPDRRRSVSYLPTFIAASTLNMAQGAQPVYASDHGHGAAPARIQCTSSIDNGSSNATSNIGRNGNGIFNFTSAARRQSIKPTPLSQVTVLTPSVSRGSISPVVHTKSPCVFQRPHTADSSGTESDVTRVGHFGSSEVDITPRVAAQSYQHSYHCQPPHPPPQQQRSRTGSSNKLARFLKARKLNQPNSNSHKVQTSIADINRIRKASISPPVFSTLVWAGHGGEFVSVKDHPLKQNAASVIAATPNILDAPSHFPPPPGPQHVDSKQGFPCVTSPALVDHISTLRSIPKSVSTDLLNEISTPLPPPPPALTSRPSQTSHGHTDESLSTFSFVHVPTAFSSPSLTQLAAPAGPNMNASITSSATMKIKRTSSRPISKLAPTFGPSLTNSTFVASNTLSGASEQASSMRVTMGEWDVPTLHSLTKAASLPVIAESGVRVTFGSLFAQRKVIVLFIRHFWCPLCQDYMISVASLARRLRPGAILGPGSGKDHELNEKIVPGDDMEKDPPVKVVVIGNGSYTMIGKYKQIFGLGAVPLDVYSDPSLAVYAALGLGKDPASLPHHPHSPTHARSKSLGTTQVRLEAQMLGGSTESACSEGRGACVKSGVRERSKSRGYVKHGLMGGIAMVFVRALKVGMPVWEKGGDLNQLGGEFILGPGLVCTYAHRMQTTKDHALFEDVLRAAGLQIPITLSRTLPSAKSRERNLGEKLDEKKPSSLRKSRPLISNTITQATKSRPRGKTIDIVPIPVIQRQKAPAMPAPASLPLASKLSQTENEGATPGHRGKESRGRRRSVVRSSTASVLNTPPSTAPAMTGPFVQLKPEEGRIEQAFPVYDSTPAVPISSLANPTGKELPTCRNYNSTLGTAPGIQSIWKEDGHRSLQKIKERKERRALSQADERQVSLSSISSHLSPSPSRSVSKSTSRSRPHSRSLSSAKSLSPCRPLGLASSAVLSATQGQYRGVERKRPRRRHRSTSAIGTSSDSERATPSETGLMTTCKERSVQRRDDDDVDEDVVVKEER